MILALHTVDCFGYRLAMIRGSVHKNFIVMLSEAKHLFAILIFVYFVKGDRGLNCHSKHAVLACQMITPPDPPKIPQPLHALQLIVLRTDYVMLHSACVNVMPTARTLPLCAVVGNIA